MISRERSKVQKIPGSKQSLLSRRLIIGMADCVATKVNFMTPFSSLPLPSPFSSSSPASHVNWPLLSIINLFHLFSATRFTSSSSDSRSFSPSPCPSPARFVPLLHSHHRRDWSGTACAHIKAYLPALSLCFASVSCCAADSTP